MLPAILFAFQALQTVMSYRAQQQLAIQQERNINAAYADSVEAANAQAAQINADAAEKMSARAREAMIERARIAAAAGESGLGGANATRVTNEADAAALRDTTRIKSDQAASLDANRRNLKRLGTEAQNTMSQVKYPSLVGSGLQIATDYMAYNKNADKQTKVKPNDKPAGQ